MTHVFKIAVLALTVAGASASASAASNSYLAVHGYQGVAYGK